MGDSQKCRSPFPPTPISSPVQKPKRPLLPCSQPASWPQARGSCGGITSWSSTSSTPRDVRCKRKARRVRAQHPCPAQASITSPSPTGTSTLATLPENTYQKASNFTRAPREEKHLPRQASGRSTFLPVLHGKPLPQGAPRAQPLTPPPGRAGRGNRDFKGH